MGTDQDSLDQLIARVITQTAPDREACESGEWQCHLCLDGRCPERDLETVRRIVDAGADRVGSTIGTKSKPEMADYIDHTLLKPDASEDELRQLCAEAREYGFASVCVNPVWITYCKEQLAGTNVMVATVVGFPLGAVPPEAKAGAEATVVMAPRAAEQHLIM